MHPAALFQLVSAAGVLFCASAYVYGFILRSRGDRRLHTAGLLFSGMAMGALGALADEITQGTSILASGSVLICLWISVICQSFAAFRGRRADRRDTGQENERVEQRGARTVTPASRAATG